MKLTVHNYGIISDLTADLKPGLTVLTGVNGSGKSTTIDALFFALTGESLDGRNLGELINWGAMDGKAVVSLSCPEFEVVRTIKSSGVAHKLTVGDTVLTKRNDINGWLFNYLKVDNPEVIRAVFISAQLRATDLFDTTNANRLALLSKVFGLEHIEQCRAAIYKVLSESLAPTVDADLLAKTAERVSLAKIQLAQSDEALKQATEELLELNFNEEEYQRVRNAPLDAEKHVRSRDRANAANHEQEIAAELATVQKLRDAFQLMFRLSEAESMEKEIERDQKELEELRGGVDIAELNKAQREAERQRDALKAEIAQLEANVVQVTTCPLTGGNPCLDLLRLHDPETVRQSLEEKRSQLQTVTSDCLEIAQLASDRLAQMTHVGSLTALLVTAKNKLAEINPPDNYKEQLAELRDNLKDYDAHDVEVRCEVLTNAHQHNLKVIEENTKWLKEHANDQMVSPEEKQFWEDQKAQQSRLLADIERIKQEKELKAQFLKENEDALAQLKACKAAAEAFQRRADNLKDVRELLSRNQLQRALLANTLARINREIQTCSCLFDFAFKIFIEDSGAISFQTDTTDEPKEVRFLSGGQKYVAAIITRIAFARVLNTNFPFMVLDEPSICLDDGSRELLAEFMGALNARFKTEGKYLVVPTHDELIISKGVKINMEEEDA